MVRVHARAHLHLLVLAVVRTRPGDYLAVIRALREQSGGRFQISTRAAHSALHYLERNRLIRRAPNDRRAYVLTASGERRLATKYDEWRSFVDGVESVFSST